MPANPSHAGVKRLWRRPLLASHFDYKTHESAARRRRRPKLSQTSNPKHRRRPRQRATLAAPATRPEIPTVRRKLARTRPPGTGPGPPGCRRPLGRREISLFVKFGLRRGGDAGGCGREAVPSGPAAHSIRSTPAGTGCAGVAGGGHDPSRPAAPPGTPGPNFRLASFKSPRVPHLLLCLLRGAPPGWRYRRPRLSAPQPRKFDKDRGRGRDRDRDPLAEGNFWRPRAVASRSPPGRKARRPAGHGGRPGGDSGPGAPGGRGGGGLRVRRGAAGRAGAPPAASAGAYPGRVPSPRSPPANFPAGPLCSRLLWRLFARPGDPTSPRSPPGARRARGPARPAARAGGSAPGPLGARRGGRAEGGAGGRSGEGGGWPVAGGGGGARRGLFTCRGTSPCRYRTRS